MKNHVLFGFLKMIVPKAFQNHDDDCFKNVNDQTTEIDQGCSKF